MTNRLKKAMNAEQLTNLLAQPQHLQSISYEELENILVEYPYCGVLRLLLLKKCQIEQHPAFEQQLQLAAVHLPDRVRLHDFLKNAQDDNFAAPPLGKIPPFPVPDNYLQEENPNDKKKTENEIIELDGMLKKSRKKRFQLPRIPALQDQSVLALLSGNHAELLPPTKKNKEQDKGSKKEQRKNFFDFAPDMDAFLENIKQKRLKTADPDFSELDTIAQKSITENEEVISETLAELLAKQGQYQRAIKMYSALSLKFPQKSNIFADKIAALHQDCG